MSISDVCVGQQLTIYSASILSAKIYVNSNGFVV